MRVSVAIITFNSESVIKDCLNSLLNQDYQDYEVIIYDNASIDKTCQIIEEFNNSKIKLIKGKFNNGFGYGLNRIAEIASGEILASLNPDTVVDKGWIKNAVIHFEKECIGMVASRILFKDRPDIIDSTGHLIYPDGLNRGRGHEQRVSDYYLRSVEVAFPSGSGGFYKKDIFLSLGGIDESLFLFGDDTDIGIKFQLAGYRCIYEPNSVVYHIYSHSTGRYSNIKAYFVERNRLQILLKYFPKRLILKSFFYTLKRVFFHNLSAIQGRGSTAGYLKNGSIFGLYKLMFMAYLESIYNVSSTLAKRKTLHRQIDLEKMEELINKFSISAKDIAMVD